MQELTKAIDGMESNLESLVDGLTSDVDKLRNATARFATFSVHTYRDELLNRALNMVKAITEFCNKLEE